MRYIKLGAVRAFQRVAPDKAQALKVLEEAAEVVEALKNLLCASGDVNYNPRMERRDLLDEIADCIQACCNLAAALGVDDMTPYLARCEERNRKRGRYDKEQQCK